MNKNIKISVIVPVYNAEKTIERCVCSILNQTYNNVEILLIDDGSNDRSLTIMKKIQSDYKNKIKVYSHENSGAGYTRNYGINNATGDYVTFVDSDDALELTALEELVNTLCKTTDVVIAGVKIKNEYNETISTAIPKKCVWSQLKFTATAFKLYRLKFLKSNKIYYKNYILNEDMLFCIEAFSKTDNIKILEKDSYIIYKNVDSITANINNNSKLIDVYDVLNYAYNEIDFSKYNKKMVQFFFIKTIVQNVLLHLEGFELNQLNRLYKKNFNWLKSLKINGSYIKLHWQNGELMSINFAVNIFILFTRLHLNKLLILVLKKSKFKC